MRIYASVIVVGALSVAGPEVALTMDEVVDVHGCAPGWTLHDAGSDWWCVADMPGGGGGGGGGGHDPSGDSGYDPGGGGGGGGGGGDGSNADPHNWDDELAEEVKKALLCNKCTTSGNKCMKQAQDAENVCKTRAAEMAVWRCAGSGAKKGDGVTIWGCTIDQLAKETCTAAEAPWDNGELWRKGCWSEGLFGKIQCGDRGITSCHESWASPHPGGSKQVTASGTLSATFEGVGGSASQTVTSTFNLTGYNGFRLACQDAGASLMAQCVGKEQQCRAQNDCASVTP